MTPLLPLTLCLGLGLSPDAGPPPPPAPGPLPALREQALRPAVCLRDPWGSTGGGPVLDGGGDLLVLPAPHVVEDCVAPRKVTSPAPRGGPATAVELHPAPRPAV